MATHSSVLAWRIPWTEGPGGLQSMGSQRVGYDGALPLLLFLEPRELGLVVLAGTRQPLEACDYAQAPGHTGLCTWRHSGRASWMGSTPGARHAGRGTCTRGPRRAHILAARSEETRHTCVLRAEQKHSRKRCPGTKLQGALPSLGSGSPFLREQRLCRDVQTGEESAVGAEGAARA